MKTNRLVLIVPLFFIAGCFSATGPAFSSVETTDANKALVYIYRPFNIIQIGVMPYIYIDEVKYGQLKSGGYLYYFVDPGKRMIEFRSSPDRTMTIYPDFIAGEEYYFRFSADAQYMDITLKVELTPKEYAIREIAQTKKSD
jgi:hypothetical protein